MTKREKRMRKLLLSLGIHSTYKGYFYLLRALEMAYEDETNLVYISKFVYPEVGKAYNTSAGCVERNLRTVVNGCWNSPFFDKLQEISPQKLVRRPTVGQFVDILYQYLKSTEDEETFSDSTERTLIGENTLENILEPMTPS